MVLRDLRLAHWWNTKTPEEQALELAAASAPPAAAVATTGPPSRLPPDLPTYFKSKYGPDVRVSEKLKETPDGPLGTLQVPGKLTMETAGGNTPEERARATTLAFLKQEATLLGIRDFSEIRQTRLKFDDSDPIERLRGACSVDYDRVLGGIPLIWNTYSFRLDPQGAITQFHAAVVPVSPGLDAAVRHEKITGAEARAIVERDLDALGLKKPALTVGEATLGAYYRAPYVLWEARGRYEPQYDGVSWYYGLDASSGAIACRSCSSGRVYARAPTGHEPGPCDAMPPIPAEGAMLPNPFYP
jgi:hypothetical protein